MCMCMRVCMCTYVYVSVYLFISVRMFLFVCMSACVRVKARTQKSFSNVRVCDIGLFYEN